MRGSRMRAIAASGLSAAGLLAGHWLAYAVAHPGAPAGHEALAPAHGWLAAAQEVVPLLAVIAAATIALERVAGWDRTGPMDRGALKRRLATLQVGAFVALEVAERLAGGGWSDLPAVAAVGVVAQLLTAWLVAVGLVGLSALGATIGSVLARAARAVAPPTGPGEEAMPRAVPASIRHRPFASRAPPSPA